jgi:heme-degrading monooxygenase HmoA
MIAVIFEVMPNTGKKDDYLNWAAELSPTLQKIAGFISIERFQSLTDPDKLLSLSFWEDEEAVGRWRNVEIHREAQIEGRTVIFRDYHLRIAEVSRNYGMNERDQAPRDSKAIHDPNDL